MSISYKLILAVACTGIITIGVFSYFNLNSHRSRLTAQIEDSAHQLSETVKSSTKYNMLLNQRESVHQIIDTIGKQEGIIKLRVFNKEGKIIYSSLKDEVGSMVDKKADACYVCHAADKPIEKLTISNLTRIYRSDKHTRYMGIINPIFNEPACWQGACHAHTREQKILGVLDVVMSLKNVDESIYTNKLEMIMFAVTAIITNSMIIWLLISRLVGSPVRKLVRATHAVSNGDLSYKIELNKKHELGYLAKSFNAMTRKLSEAQRMLHQSDKLSSLGRLAAGVAHEINNPLTGVLTYSSYHAKRAEANSELKNDLDIIVRETNRCREIVKGLLDFARQVPPKKSRVNMNEVLGQSLGMVENQLALNRIKVIKNLKENLPEVNIDKNQMLQVYINLLVNAADAIGDGGTITVSTDLIERDKAPFVEVRIEDTGSGIPKEVQEKIFEPFYTTKGQKGNGLGLATVWGIIDEHLGKISFESEVGKGTTFIIQMPV